MGYKISLFVLPKGQADLVWVGTVDSDDALMFRDACWSVDGSVVACRAALIVYNRAPTNVLDSTVFTHTYDFRNGQPIVAPKDDTDEETGWDARNQKIEALLQERGGKAPPLSGDSTTWTRVPYFEWRAFEKLEKVGR